MKDQTAEISAAATKVVPSLTVVGATIFGYTIQEVAALMGCAFILMQMLHLGWKWGREWKNGRSR